MNKCYSKALEDTVSLTFTGDFFCSMQCDTDERSLIIAYLSGKANPVINFEGSWESDTLTKKAVRLAADPSILNSLEKCTLSLANNHVLDYGEKGLNSLMSTLDHNSISYFGINTNSSKVDNYKVINFSGIRVCFLGFGAKNEECIAPAINTPGILDFNSNNLRASISALDSDAFDYLVVYAHVGYEFEKYPLPLHVGVSREAVDLGADFVYCSHTHCLQPYELYKDKYIFYGLGNFYFSNNREMYPTDSDVGAMVSIVLSRNEHQVRLAEVERITYMRPPTGLEIDEFEGYLEDWELKTKSLENYSKNYSKTRTRKKNPRPILYYDAALSNTIKYLAWKVVVDITGMLGVRQFVKRVLRWQ